MSKDLHVVYQPDYDKRYGGVIFEAFDKNASLEGATAFAARIKKQNGNKTLIGKIQWVSEEPDGTKVFRFEDTHFEKETDIAELGRFTDFIVESFKNVKDVEIDSSFDHEHGTEEVFDHELQYEDIEFKVYCEDLNNILIGLFAEEIMGYLDINLNYKPIIHHKKGNTFFLEWEY